MKPSSPIIAGSLTPASAGGGDVAGARQTCADNILAGSGTVAGISRHGARNDVRSVRIGDGTRCIV